MIAPAPARWLRVSTLRSALVHPHPRLRPSLHPSSTAPACLGNRTAATYTSRHQAAQISVLQTAVDTNSTSYVDNKKSMQELLDSFTTLHRNAALGGPEKAREKHVARGKMLVRE